ncbi:hypothetical protein BWQ96_06912 [Gracilariopsis chorda]|uniref:Uncharacterized protein n=1 Tax=Gracilariopsis chorda TaxID=448386 RepID=A0A2V3IMS7_9FLOR|nr:hypothetical protein BWQ96_06912 [Gracilariopsis chorda]|eukprot:PXF43349.1 hypothetical protein BWQ96_06912 [Gracilariopsis chorda]
MIYKLCTYIVNSPPDGRKKKVDGKKDKATRTAAKACRATGELVDTDDKRCKRKAAKKAAKKVTHADAAPGELQFSAANFATAIDDKDEDEQWSVDTSKEAQEAHQRELVPVASTLERAPVKHEWNKVGGQMLQTCIDRLEQTAGASARSE